MDHGCKTDGDMMNDVNDGYGGRLRDAHRCTTVRCVELIHSRLKEILDRLD